MEEKLIIPEKIEVKFEKNILIIKGKNGEVTREFRYPGINIKINTNEISISSKKDKKNNKKIIGSFKAHIKNMFKGASEGHLYKLKVCAGHFPVNISVKNNELIVKNFLGEKVPRVLKLKQGVNVKIDGEIITVEGSNKELTAQTAADIELLSKVKNRDLRIFQDGIYIVHKDGKDLK